MKFVDLASQFASCEAEIRREIEEVLATGQFVLGPKGSALESLLASYAGAAHGIGCSSGTDALLLALMAHGVRAGDEIVTTPFTFIATAEAIALTGASPVFVDIDPVTFNIAPDRIDAALTRSTRGILPVSLYGQCADMERILGIGREYGLFVLEDGAQSFGAERNGRRSCGFPQTGVTSFFPSKPLGCYGDGGMVFTSDDSLADRVRGLRNHGQWERYRHRVIGLNGRLDEIQAAVLLGKFPRFEREVAERSRLGARYTERLADVVTVPADRGAGCAGRPSQRKRRSDRGPLPDPAASAGGVPRPGARTGRFPGGGAGLPGGRLPSDVRLPGGARPGRGDPAGPALLREIGLCAPRRPGSAGRL